MGFLINKKNQILNYFNPSFPITFQEQKKSDAFVTLILISILLVLVLLVLYIAKPNENSLLIYTSLGLILLVFIFGLFLNKFKGIVWSGNLISLAIVISVAIFINILSEDRTVLYKYLQGFYSAIAVMSVAVLFASRKVMIVNAAIIILSATHVFVFSIEHEPEKYDLLRSGYIQYLMVVMGLAAILYFAIKFSEEAIHLANEDARAKELKNQELAASEEEIRASNEELQTTSDALREINEELYLAKVKADESSRLKSAFLTNISHEIRTPMNGIIGFARLLEDSELPDETRTLYLNVIINSSDKLLKIIDDTLEISRLASKSALISNNLVNINDLFSKLSLVFKQKTEKLGIDLIFNSQLSDTESLFYTDESKLFKILNSLIDNSVKFTNHGYIKTSVTLNDIYIKFEVEDTGIGFDINESHNITESFVHADEKIAVKYGGLGVGLTIAKELVELLEGKLEFESEINQGSKFRFNIPYIPLSIQAQEMPVVANNHSIEQIKGKQIILIVDDEEYNFMVLSEIIKKLKFDVEILKATNGLEAIEVCKKNSMIDMVFMDIKMPVMNGVEATKKIKEFAPNLTIIAQSAYVAKVDELQALKAGCSDFIAKPIKIAVLKQILSKYLVKDVNNEQIF